MDGFQIQRVMLPSNIHFYQVKTKTMIFVDGFSGIADIGWVGENQKWMKSR
jgi:hypothetical protein